MTDSDYINRCIELAKLASGFVAPNPMVGAVLVYEDKIIGEGYHQQYGKPHAEVNCINSVKSEDRKLIPYSTMYVSLEPCAHHGKTPPCADLLIEQCVKKVVIGTKDIFAKVNGLGIQKLQNAGIEVKTGILEDRCRELNKRFFTFHQYQRPYIILKWAQTGNGIIGTDTNERLLITNKFTNTLVHKWRSEEDAILVGTNTVLKDNPELTNRLHTGNNPVRMFIDKDLRVSADFNILNNKAKTIVFNNTEQKNEGENIYIRLNKNISAEEQIVNYCYQNQLQSILIEGGAVLLQSFINKGLWDECRVITNTVLFQQKGVKAPALKDETYLYTKEILTDRIDFYKNKIV